MTDTLDRTDVALAEIPLAKDIVPTDRRLLPAPLERLQEAAAIIQQAGGLVPAELRKDAGACMAVAYMAALHGTDLVSTASQTYVVSGKIAFMAQYINALVQRHFAEKPIYTYQGTGPSRAVRVTAKLKSGQVIEYTSPQVGQIKVKNSPLWQTDPDQQLAYYSIRALARRHMPDVLLGIYAVEELQSVQIRDVTPPKPADLDGDLEELEHVEATVDGEQEPFEPSGGFTTATDERTSEPPPPAADDILAWAEECKADAREAESPAALQAIWDGCEANRRKLWRTERAAHDELETAFKDRLADLN